MGLLSLSTSRFFLACAAPEIIPTPEAQLDIASASVGLLVKGLEFLMPNIEQSDVMAKVAGGSYRLLTYAIDFWIEHCLLYITSVGDFTAQGLLLEWLARLQDKHDHIIRGLHHTAHVPDADALPSDTEVDRRLHLYAGRPAQTIMRHTLTTRQFVSRGKCENGKDAESSMKQHDPTLFSRLAIEFERIRVHLLSHQTVDSVSPSSLLAFQKSYASITLRCRFPNCLKASEGFSSEQLRDRHEISHVQRIYCRVESCQYHRIGFMTKTGYDKHDRNFHRANLAVLVPPKIRRVGRAQDFRLALRMRTDRTERIETPRDPKSLTALDSPSSSSVGSVSSPPASPPARTAAAKPKFDKFGATLLAREAEAGDLAGVKAAYAAARDELDRSDYAGIAPLQKAALQGHEDVVAFLLEAGCRIDCMSGDGDTPLIDAVENSHLGVIKLLLRNGVDPHHQNKKGKRAIDVLDQEDEDAEEIERELKDAIYRRPMIPKDVSSTLPSQAKSSSRLLYNEYNVETLQEKCGDGDILAVGELINNNIRPNNACGVAAARGGHHDILSMLLASGLNPDPDPAKHPETPMTVAIGRGHIKIIELLLEQDGFDPTRRDWEGKTYFEISGEIQGPWGIEAARLLQPAYIKYYNDSASRAKEGKGKVEALQASPMQSRSSSLRPRQQAHRKRSSSSQRDRSLSPQRVPKKSRLKSGMEIKRRERVVDNNSSLDESEVEVGPPAHKERRLNTGASASPSLRNLLH
ncbi:hypothetical protein FB567DRAFT_235606 [Paraphoma chrysanthemicola]|uniref:KRIT1 ARM-repeats domain-containing protein n=1 Tax=Paraphoma chrysanthemicola TaxID=798071 RepID=A0A8K0W2L4_9PLEO|nr:hypothetical protein FB567DRAFT_235606 [Paraphoma chrysanthemicola]